MTFKELFDNNIVNISGHYPYSFISLKDGANSAEAVALLQSIENGGVSISDIEITFKNPFKGQNEINEKASVQFLKFWQQLNIFRDIQIKEKEIEEVKRVAAEKISGIQAEIDAIKEVPESYEDFIIFLNKKTGLEWGFKFGKNSGLRVDNFRTIYGEALSNGSIDQKTVTQTLKNFGILSQINYKGSVPMITIRGDENDLNALIARLLKPTEKINPALFVNNQNG